jgi:hypothetical protein
LIRAYTVLSYLNHIKKEYRISHENKSSFSIRKNKKIQFKCIKDYHITIYNNIKKIVKIISPYLGILYIATEKIYKCKDYKFLYYKKNNSIGLNNKLLIRYNIKKTHIIISFFNCSKRMKYEFYIKYYKNLKYKTHNNFYYEANMHTKYIKHRIFINNKYELLYSSNFFIINN